MGAEALPVSTRLPGENCIRLSACSEPFMNDVECCECGAMRCDGCAGGDGGGWWWSWATAVGVGSGGGGGVVEVMGVLPAVVVLVVVAAVVAAVVWCTDGGLWRKMSGCGRAIEAAGQGVNRRMGLA